MAGERAPGHDRGRLSGQVAVMLAAGGRCVADMGAPHRINDSVLDVLRTARAEARAPGWW